MNPYNEQQHEGDDLPVIGDDGEIQKSQKAPKVAKNQRAIKLITYFGKQCQSKLHILRVSSKGEYFSALRVVEEFDDKQITKFVKEWFASGEDPETLVSLNRAFSFDQINKFKARHGIQ